MKISKLIGGLAVLAAGSILAQAGEDEMFPSIASFAALQDWDVEAGIYTVDVAAAKVMGGNAQAGPRSLKERNSTFRPIHATLPC